MKINHYTVLAIVSILLTIAGLSWLSYTITNLGGEQRDDYSKSQSTSETFA